MIILLILGLLILLVSVTLRREIRSDGFGLRLPPRSRPDEDEPRWVQLARLSR